MNTYTLRQRHQKSIALLDMIDRADCRVIEAQKMLNMYAAASWREYPWKDLNTPFYEKRVAVNKAIISRLISYYFKINSPL